MASAARQHRAHFVHQIGARRRMICAGRSLDPFGAAFDGFGEFGAERKVLERHLALGAFVGAFDHGDGGAALVGIFELVAASCLVPT